jgi:hypothetical protein
MLHHLSEVGKYFSVLNLVSSAALTGGFEVQLVVKIASFLLNASFVMAILYLTLQRGVTGTARMLHALTHSSISRQVREQM